MFGFDASSTFLWHLFLTPIAFGGGLALYLLSARVGLIDPDGSHIPRLSRVRDRREGERTSATPSD